MKSLEEFGLQQAAKFTHMEMVAIKTISSFIILCGGRCTYVCTASWSLFRKKSSSLVDVWEPDGWLLDQGKKELDGLKKLQNSMNRTEASFAHLLWPEAKNLLNYTVVENFWMFLNWLTALMIQCSYLCGLCLFWILLRIWSMMSV